MANQTVLIPIAGMDCTNCALSIENALKKTSGVNYASASFADEKANINFDPSRVSVEDLSRIIDGLGFKALPVDMQSSKEDEIRQRYIKRLLAKVILGIVFSAAIFLLSNFNIPVLNNNLALIISFVLATIVQFWIGAQFYSGFWGSLKQKAPDMNTLVAVGTSAAYIYSFIAMFFPAFFTSSGIRPGMYFDTSAVIISFVLLGRYLETNAKSRTGKAIKDLHRLASKTATVVRDGREILLPVEQVQVGDIIIVKPGEKIATDGKIIDGSSAIDESMVTGESIPADKAAGSIVIGGTINKTGSFKFIAEKVGKDTLLAQIIRMVREAQSSKAPIQRIADRAAAIFVPAVISIAALTFLIWMIFGPKPSFNYAFLNFVAVLVISCPCALGLATPTAVIVGIGRASRSGILVKNAEALETAHKINVVVFDKTGTLTEGKPEVTDKIVNPGSYSAKDLLYYAGSAEKRSEHPLGAAIVEEAGRNGIALTDPGDFNSLTGSGITGSVNGKHVSVGSKAFMESNGIDSSLMKEDLDRLSENGKTVMCVAVEGNIAGLIALKDKIKPSAKETIKQLHNMGIKTVLMTGDNINTAKAVAKEIGIDEIIAGVLPQNKAGKIKELQSSGNIVAMAGDGINDAPALKQADVGIAMGKGADIAVESSDIALMTGDPENIISVIKLSKLTISTIKQNLFWAFIYNIVGIPVAAGILYPFFGILLNPMIASASMALSSVSVVANSLLLNKKTINK